MPNPKLETYKNKATGDVYDYTDADAQGKLTAILDGTTIDSFSDVESALADKVDVVSGKGLSTNDYDDTEKAKVAGAFPRSEQAVLGAKNLLPNNWSWEDTGTLGGITLTRNSDDTITVGAGTVSGGGGKWLFNTTLANLGIKKGRYKVTANIPSSLGGNVFFTIKDNTGNVTYNVTGSTQEVEFEVTDENINHTWHIYTWFNNNTVISESFVMQPMIRLASDTDNTFAPHVMTNEQLTNNNAVKELTITPSTGITLNNNSYARIRNGILNAYISFKNENSVMSPFVTAVQISNVPNIIEDNPISLPAVNTGTNTIVPCYTAFSKSSKLIDIQPRVEIPANQNVNVMITAILE